MNKKNNYLKKRLEKLSKKVYNEKNVRRKLKINKKLGNLNKKANQVKVVYSRKNNKII